MTGIVCEGEKPSTTRGVAFSPSGTHLYVTSASDDVRSFALPAGSELPRVSTSSPGASLHDCAVLGNELFVAALNASQVYRFAIASDGALTESESFPAASPSSVTFSPDGREAFAVGHRDSDILSRLRYADGSQTWTNETTTDLGTSLGDVLVLP